MERFYYISQGNTPEEQLLNIQKVLDAGCRLIQLRMKDFSEEKFLETAIAAVQLAHTYDAKLIINDNLNVAVKSNAHGVHLGADDADPKIARQQLGAAKIVGGTANTLEKCQELIAKNVDYVGLGPFAHTTTKKNLSPILGIEGYKTIMEDLAVAGLSTPVYAIGGIKKENLDDILRTGVHGWAVSDLFTKSEEKIVRELIEEFQALAQ